MAFPLAVDAHLIIETAGPQISILSHANRVTLAQDTGARGVSKTIEFASDLPLGTRLVTNSSHALRDGTAIQLAAADPSSAK